MPLSDRNSRDPTLQPEIRVKRVDRQKLAVGIVAGVIDPKDRRIVAYGTLANGDPRTLDGDTIFEIGSSEEVVGRFRLGQLTK